MTKFNSPVTISQRLRSHPDAVVNPEGGLAFKVSPEMELYLRACTSLLEDKFYESKDEQLKIVRSLVSKCDRGFVLKLARYVRNEMNLRSFPIMLLVEASRLGSVNPDTGVGEPKPDVRQFTPQIVNRVDEIMEALAYYMTTFGGGSDKKIPQALRKGLADAFEKFDEYQFAKYNRKGLVTLKDALRIVHPKPSTAERSELYSKIRNDNLATPETWEVVISTKGSTRENWEAVAPKMGFMAVLRNLRNFEKVGATEAIGRAIKMLRDPEQVKKSKQLPFRFYSAWREVTDQRLKDALLEALDISVANLDPWSGDTVILVDLSGSMNCPISRQSSIHAVDIACILGAMATGLCQGSYKVGVFADRFKWVQNLSKRDSVISNMEKIRNTNVGGSTFAYLAVKAMVDERVKADRVVLLSDEQCYDSSRSMYGESLAEWWTRYVRQVNPKATLYSIDLIGYSTTQFPEDETSVVKLAGWSERVLDLVKFYENRGNVLDLIKSL